MNITQAKRLTVDISSHDPAHIERLARVFCLELSRIQAEETAKFPDLVETRTGIRHLLPRTPCWGVLRYRLDPKRRTP